MSDSARPRMGIVTAWPHAATVSRFQPVPFVAHRNDGRLFKGELRNPLCRPIRHSGIERKTDLPERWRRIRQALHRAEREAEHCPHTGAEHLRTIHIAAVSRQQHAGKPQCLRRAQDRPQIAGVLQIFDRQEVSLGGKSLQPHRPRALFTDTESPLRRLGLRQQFRHMRRQQIRTRGPGDHPLQIRGIPLRRLFGIEQRPDRDAAVRSVRTQTGPLDYKKALAPPEFRGGGELCGMTHPFIFSACNHFRHHFHP